MTGDPCVRCGRPLFCATRFGPYRKKLPEGMVWHNGRGMCATCTAAAAQRRRSQGLGLVGGAPRGAYTGDCDEIAIERACAGERMPLSVPERREVTAILTRRGHSIFGIAELLGVTPRTVIRYRAQLRGTAA